MTFLFVDLVGSTDLLHRIGDDANDELTRRYQGIMREAVERHGGEVLRTMGDGLVIVFEHSVAAALSTAVDMHRAIDRMGRTDPLLRLQIRVGLSVGEASKLDGDWSGTPIFEAARLESKARPGTILVNDVMRVLIGNRGGFEFTPVGALELKGFPEPLPASEVAWEPDPGRPEIPLASALEVGLDWPLVGREVELQRLRDAWVAAAAGEPSIVAVTGDGGIGKTRLVAELAVAVQRGGDGGEAAGSDHPGGGAGGDDDAGDAGGGGAGGRAAVVPGGTVLYGRAGADPGPPLGAFAEALRWWAASVPPEVLRAAVGDDAPVLVGVVPSLAARLPELLGGGVAADAAELADALARVMDRATEATGAWLVIVDAAHSADEATFDLMTRITQGDLAVLVVAVGREPGRFAGADRIELGGLDVDATGALLGEVTAHAGVDDPTADVVTRTHVETAGNPRLIIEAGERLVASGAMGLDAGAGRDEVVRRAITGVSPYKGLLAYQADDAEDFFGRDTDVAALLARVAASRLLAVVGASGSGKSSLVRAGLLPSLRRGALAGSAEWPQVLLNAGARPLLELAAGVATALNQPAGEVMSALEAGGGGLDDVLRRAASGSGTAPARVVIVIDQFEEIFTACQDDAERERFAETLLHAATVPDGRALVIAVMRSDFFGHCAELPGLAAALESSTVLLGPMDEGALRAVIEGPARRADLTLEPGLADAMIHDVAGEPGGLPLLSHALYETWERREHRALTLAGYRDAGGARGAIARTAENVYATGLTADQQQIARSLFLDLTELGEGTEDTRRRAQRADLDERAGGADRLEPVLTVLVGSRLVTVGDDTVEVAHEALIREWPRLRDWLDEDRETLRALRHLSTAAADWDHGGRDPADLYRGPRLVAALDASATAALTDRDQQFLAASRDVEEAEVRRQRVQNRRLRRALAGVGVLLVCALIAGVVAFQQRSEANDQRATADARTADADFERLISQSVDLAESNPSLAFLLARQANAQRDNAASRSALFTTLQRNRSFFGYTPTDGVPTGATLRGDTLVYGTRDGMVGFSDLDSGQPVADTIAVGDDPDALVHVFVADDQPAGRDETVVVARADTGEIVRIDPRSHEVVGRSIDAGQPLFALAASARLGLIAVGGEDGTVALFDLESGDEAGVLPAQTDPTNVEAPSPVDGANELYGAGDAIIDDGDAVALAFSPTERQLAVLRPDSSVEFWDPATRRMVVASEPSAVKYEPELGELVYRPDGDQIIAFDNAVDPSLLAADPADGSIDWASFKLTDQGVFSPNGDVLYVSATGGTVVGLDPSDGAPTGVELDNRLGVLAGMSLRDEQLVFTSGSEAAAGGLSVGRDGAIVTPLGDATVETLPQQIAPDASSVLLVDAHDGPAQVWDPVSGRAIVEHIDMRLGGYTGDRTLLGLFSDLTAGLYDIDAGHRIPPPIEFDATGFVNAIISRQTGFVAVGREDGTIDFYAANGERPFPSIQADGAARIQALSNDGRLIFVASLSGQGSVYDTHTGELVAGPVSGVSAAIFRPDSEAVFVAANDGGLEELALPSLESIGEPFPDIKGVGLNLNISDDGRTLGVADLSNRYSVIDTASRSVIGDPIQLGSLVAAQNGELSPTGGFMVLSREDGVETWDLVPDHWRDAACRLAGRNLTQEEWDTYLPNAGSYQKTCEEWPAGA